MAGRSGTVYDSVYPSKSRVYNGYRDDYDEYVDDRYYAYNSPSQYRARYSDYSDYNSYRDKSDRIGSYGHGSFSGGYGDKCPGISIALLLISLLGIALMGYIFYLKVVDAGRKKRATPGIDGFLWFAENIESIVFRGNFFHHDREHISTCMYPL